MSAWEPLVPMAVAGSSSSSTATLEAWLRSKGSLQGPHPDCAWVTPNLLVGAYPGHANRELHGERLRSLVSSRVRTFVNLMPVEETFALRPYEEDVQQIWQNSAANRKQEPPGDDEREVGTPRAAKHPRRASLAAKSLSVSVSALGPRTSVESIPSFESESENLAAAGLAEEDMLLDSVLVPSAISSSSCVSASSLESHAPTPAALGFLSAGIVSAGIVSELHDPLRSEDGGAAFQKASSASAEESPRFLHVPIVDRDVAPDAVLLELVESLLKTLRSRPDEVVYLHCWAGRGRSGTVASVLAARYWNMEADMAMRWVQTCHDSREDVKGFASPETQAQMDQVRRVLSSSTGEAVSSVSSSSSGVTSKAERRAFTTVDVDSAAFAALASSCESILAIEPLSACRSSRKRKLSMGELPTLPSSPNCFSFSLASSTATSVEPSPSSSPVRPYPPRSLRISSSSSASSSSSSTSAPYSPYKAMRMMQQRSMLRPLRISASVPLTSKRSQPSSPDSVRS